MSRKSFGLLFIVLIHSFGLLSQDFIWREVDVLDDHRFSTLAQTEDGVLWLTDEYALYNFDGVELVQKAMFPRLDDPIVASAAQGDQLLIGTDGGCLYRWQANGLDSLHCFDKSSIKQILPLSDGRFLIATAGSGVHTYNSATAALNSFDIGQSLDYVNLLLEYQEQILVGTDQGILIVNKDGSGLRPLPGISGLIIDAIATDGDNLYLGEYDGEILRYNSSLEANSQSWKVDGRIKNLHCTADRLLIGTEKGILQWNLEDMDQFNARTGSLASPFDAMLVDDEGNLWATRENKTEVSSTSFSKSNFPIEAEVHSIDAQDGLIYLGTDQGVLCWNPTSGAQKTMWGGVNITSCDISSGTIAAGSYDSGLWIDEEEKTIVLSTEDGLADNTILALAFASETDLVVSTLAGVNRLKREGGQWKVTERIPSMDTYYILSIFIDGDVIWFGTDRKGVVRYENGMANQMDKTTDGQATGSVQSICRSSDRALYMTSARAGLLRLSDNELQRVESPNGKWELTTSVVPLDNGSLFLIGENAASIFNPNELSVLEYNKDVPWERSSSFLNNYCLLGTDVLFEHHGFLYHYHAKNQGNRMHSVTSLTSVEVDLVSIDTTTHVFSEEENDFTFRYRGVLHRNPDRLTYSYRLNGFDSDWRVTEDRQVSYPHLPIGEYEFQLRSSQDPIGEQQAVSSYAFDIRPLFYNTWWFRLLLVSAILMVVFWFVNQRRKAKALEARLSLLSTESQLINLKSQLNPHFLFNSFNTVIGLIEEDKERSIQFVEHLTDFYRHVLEVGERELISIDEELTLLESYVQLLNERFGDGLLITIERPFTPSLVPPMSLQLLVENAVKHNVVKVTDPLEITLKEEGGHVFVTNPLRLRSSPERGMGIGLENLKQRYLLLAGEKVEIRTTEGRFEIRLPLIDLSK